VVSYVSLVYHVLHFMTLPAVDKSQVLLNLAGSFISIDK
jgi:hypothetical protein